MKKIIFIILLLSGCIYNFAQTLEFKASASPRVLREGEQFRLIYQFNEDASDLQLPDLKDFQLLGGPSVSQSSSFEFINGKTRQSSQYIYTYYLRAVKSGTYSVPPAKAKFKGKEYESNALTIEVVASGSSPQQSAPGQSQPQQQQPSINDEEIKTGDEIFARIFVDKRSVYVGEQVIAWIKVYTKVPIYDLDHKSPEYSGFYKQEIEIPEIRSERESVNGDIYEAAVIEKVVLYPQKTGEITIEPAGLKLYTRRLVRSRIMNVPVDLKTNSVKLNVKPLPSRPSSFTGAVGNFTMNAATDKTTLKTNEALTYKITISGKGNIKLIDNPTVNFPPNIEQFDPKITINQSSELSGTKTFEYVLIPRFAGNYKIPSFGFSYFDPSNNDYVTLKSDEFEIHVEKGSGDTSNVVVSGLTKEDFRLLGTDILFIKNKPFTLSKEVSFIFGSTWFFAAYAGVFAALILIILLRKETIKRKSNMILVKNRKANKMARKRLKNAYSYMKQNKHEKFYEEVTRALWGYMSDKLAIPVAELSRESSREELKKRNVDDALIDEIFSLADHCEYARYAPGAVSDGINHQYEKSVELIGKLEQELK